MATPITAPLNGGDEPVRTAQLYFLRNARLIPGGSLRDAGYCERVGCIHAFAGSVTCQCCVNWVQAQLGDSYVLSLQLRRPRGEKQG